jgi:hypothetical protein
MFGVCVCGARARSGVRAGPFQLSKHLSEFYEISCEHYIIRVHPNAVFCFATVNNNNMADAHTFEARVTLMPIYS